MKKLKYLAILLMSVLFIPFGVYAEESNNTQTDQSTENIISSIYFDISEFTPGETFPSITVDEDTKIYTDTITTTWYNTDTDQITDDTTISRYYAKVDVTLTDGNKFDVSRDYLNYGVTYSEDGYINYNDIAYVFDENSSTFYIYFKVDAKRVEGNWAVPTTEFEIGKTAPTIQINNYDYYDIKLESSWHNDTDNTSMMSDTTIEKGKTYTLTIVVYPKEDYILEEDNFNLSLSELDYHQYLNNKTCEFVDGKAIYKLTFTTKNKIDYATNYPMIPYINSTVEKATIKNNSEYDYYSYKEIWYNLTDNKEMALTDIFEANKKYQYTLTLKANDGYMFGNHFKIDNSNIDYVINTTSNKSADNTEYTYQVEYYLQDESNEIGEYIKIEILNPEVGNTVAYNNYETDKYTVSGEWINYTTGEVLASTATFENNNTYTYKVTVTAKNNYKINTYNTYFDVSYDEKYTTSGGYGSSSEEDLVDTYTMEYTFVLSDKLEEDSYLFGGLYMESPVVGENIHSLVYDTNYFTVDQIWYNVTDNKYLTEKDKIEANKIYEYRLRITPDEGYTIIPNTFVFDIYDRNSIYSGHTMNYHDGLLDLILTFDTNVEYKTVDINLDLSKIIPEVGKTPVYLNPEIEGLNIYEHWYMNDDNEEEVFKENSYYSYVISFNTKKGYKIGNINIDTSMFDDYSYYYNNNDYLSYDFSFRITNPKAYKPSAYVELDLSNLTTQKHYSRNYNSIYVDKDTDSIEIPITAIHGSKLVINEVYGEAEVEIQDNKLIISGLSKDDTTSINFNIYGNKDYVASYYSLNIQKLPAYAKIPVIKNYEGIKDGNNHTITVEEYDGVLLYSTDGVNFSETLPTFSEVGIHKVYVKPTSKEGYYDLYPIEGLVIINSDLVIDKQEISDTDSDYVEMASMLEEKGYEVYEAYEFTLVSGDISDGYVISFDLGTENNGKLAYVLHKKHDGSYEEWTEKIIDGKIYIKVYEFSPFLIGLKNTVSSGSSTGTTTTPTSTTTPTTTITTGTTSAGSITIPNTSDDIMKYIILLFVSLIGMTSIKMRLNFNK